MSLLLDKRLPCWFPSWLLIGPSSFSSSLYANSPKGMKNQGIKLLAAETKSPALQLIVARMELRTNPHLPIRTLKWPLQKQFAPGGTL